MSQQQTTAQIVLSILNELAARTDNEHGMTLRELSQRVNATEKTVRAHLHAMRDCEPLGRRVRHLSRADLRGADSPDARPGWCIAPGIDPAIARLIADGLAIARIDDGTLHDIIEKLRPLAGHSMRAGTLRASSLQSGEHLNREFLVNVQKLDEAIESQRRITYHYCAYDDHGNLVPRLGKDGEARAFEADPYRLLYKNGRYYLLCHQIQQKPPRPGQRPHRDHLSYLYVDRFRDLELRDEDVPLDRTLDSFAEPNPDGTPGTFDVEAYLDAHPYTVVTHTVDITMRVKNALEPVYDWFPRAQVEPDPRPDPEGKRSFIVRVRADEQAALWWAMQFAYVDPGNINRAEIEILEPASMRDSLLDAARQLLERYGDGATR